MCGYPLEGLTESSRGPECGNPIVEVLRWPDRANPARGKRWRSRASFRGKPLIHVATGPGPVGTIGRTRGFIAVGGLAVGLAGSLSGLGMHSPLGLPMPETIWNAAILAGGLLALTAVDAGLVVLRETTRVQSPEEPR